MIYSQHDLLYTAELDYDQMLTAVQYENAVAKELVDTHPNTAWMHTLRCAEILIQLVAAKNDREN